MLARIALFVFAGFFVLAGVYHFARPVPFIRIIPPWITTEEATKRLLVALSGVAEVALGLALLSPLTRPAAAWGIIALLCAVFPANVYMFQHPEKFRIAPWILAARLPLQGVLIYWASRYI